MADAIEDRLPREDLYRAQPEGGYEIREGEDGRPRLSGHFAVFNEWTEISSLFEGHFMERLVPGALKKTLNERGQRILFNHGRDPSMGNKILAPVDILREDDKGGFYDSPLLEGIPSLIVSGLREGVYGASFRFRVLHEEIVEKPKRSDHNPEGLAERSIKEAEVLEFGPVTFPAYAGATSGVRSLTDEYRIERVLHQPDHLAQVIEFTREGIWQRGAIPSHNTSVVDNPNHPSGNDIGTACKSRADYRYCHAWVDSNADPELRSSYKFPHHMPSGPAIIPLVRNGLARLPQADIPSGDVDGVRRHLQNHLDANREAGQDHSHEEPGSATSAMSRVDRFIERRNAHVG